MRENFRNGEFTKKDVKRVDGYLKMKLGPEYICYRPGWNGTKVAYIEGWSAISLANDIFGFNGWSSEIKSITIDYLEEGNGKISIGVSCISKITLKDGTCREDVGFGSAENQKLKSQAYEKAKKEATTDALKRTLRQFGNALGNCCYDKEFLKNIKNVQKEENEVFHPSTLLRRKEFNPLNVCKENGLDEPSFESDDVHFTCE